MVQSSPWENTGIYYPSVIFDNGKFKMIYSNVNPNTSFGMAASSDGITWVKDDSNPIFNMQETSNGCGIGAIAYPCFTKLTNEYRIYYSGRISNSIIHQIGFVSK